MIKRVEDENLSKVRGGKGDGRICKCFNACPCDATIPGDGEAAFEIYNDSAENRVPGPKS